MSRRNVNTVLYKWLCKLLLGLNIDLFTVFFSTFDMDKFGKIRRHHSKERLKISKIAKFGSDLLKTNEYTAPQSREILQTFVCWGHKLAPNIQTSEYFHNFAEHPFQNLSLRFILEIFLKFCRFQPRYSYKIYSYNKIRVYIITAH